MSNISWKKILIFAFGLIVVGSLAAITFYYFVVFIPQQRATERLIKINIMENAMRAKYCGSANSASQSLADICGNRNYQ